MPDSTSAAVLLDLTVPYAGLLARTELLYYAPALAVSYRLVSPPGELVQGSRAVHFHFNEATTKRARKRPRPTASGGSSGPSKSAPVLAPDSSCEFRSFGRVIEQSEKVWQCFDEALQRVAAQVARDLRESPHLAGCRGKDGTSTGR